MEHTHLVKGLDYSLLNKVRGEMHDTDDRDELEKAYEVNWFIYFIFKYKIFRQERKRIN